MPQPPTQQNIQVCGPVLKVYSAALLDDLTTMLKDVTHGLVQERFRGFPWLVESMKHEVDLLLENKRLEARRVLDRIINSEVNRPVCSRALFASLCATLWSEPVDVCVHLIRTHRPIHPMNKQPMNKVNWIFVNEADLNAIEREVALNMTGKTGGGLGAHKAAPVFAEPHDTHTHWSAELSKVIGLEELQGSGVTAPLTQLDPDRDIRIRQLALDAYVRLMLRRVFYAVPMNVRNVLLSEFRRDIVSTVAHKYNNESTLRSMMSEEIWLGQLRQHRQDRKASLEGVLARLDGLS